MNLRLERLLSIVFLLLNREKITAMELAEKFQVSERTIYRDIKTINLAGIPIVSHTGQTGGFSIIEDYRIDKQVLSVKEMTSIVNALKGVNASLQNQEIDNIIEKICDLMPRNNLHENLVSNTAVAIDLVPWGMSKQYQKTLKTINAAIENRTIITFKYTRLGGTPTWRTVEPMTMMFKGYTWYLFGYCRLRKDYRVFRINRIRKLQAGHQLFIRKQKSYHEYLNWNEKAPAVTLTLKFAKEMHFQVGDQFQENEIIYDEDGNMIVTTTMPENNWVYGYILSFGSFVEVLAPEKYRRVIAEEGRKIMQIYKKNSGQK
ncbi:MAG: helix-turn-helix transcriptional regulator [Fidelibacterota bacterium]